MKRIKFIYVGLLMSALMLASCASEETTVANKSKTVEFAKTDAMLNFESSLKNWFLAKREISNETSRKAVEQQISKDARALLTAIGQTETANKMTQSTDELVRAAMKAYSEKLTEIYKAQLR